MIKEGINRCTIKGEILHIYEHPYNGSVVVTIGTSGNKPNVVFLNKIAEQLKAGYNVGDFILVEGNIQSSYSYAKGIRISIIADNILPLSSTPNRYENHFEVYGTIKSIVKFGKMHNIFIIIIKTQIYISSFFIGNIHKICFVVVGEYRFEEIFKFSFIFKESFIN